MSSLAPGVNLLAPGKSGNAMNGPTGERYSAVWGRLHSGGSDVGVCQSR